MPPVRNQIELAQDTIECVLAGVDLLVGRLDKGRGKQAQGANVLIGVGQAKLGAIVPGKLHQDHAHFAPHYPCHPIGKEKPGQDCEACRVLPFRQNGQASSLLHASCDVVQGVETMELGVNGTCIRSTRDNTEISCR